MKYFYPFVISLIFSSVLSKAQTPEKINYQAVARNAAGSVLANQALSIQFDIHSNTATGAIVFTETQSLTTNAYGLFTSSIGSVSSLASLDWGNNTYFLEVSIDDGSGMTSMGTTQLVSVPYALYAKEAANAVQYTAGQGISINGSMISNTGDTSATDDILIGTSAGGDLSGTYPYPVVSGLQSRAVSAGAPADGQVLKWNSSISKWEPANDVGGGAGDNWGNQVVEHDISLSGNGISSNLLGIAQQGASTGQVLKWTGSAWAPAFDDTGSAPVPPQLWQQGLFGLYYSGNIGIGTGAGINTKLRISGNTSIVSSDSAQYTLSIQNQIGTNYPGTFIGTAGASILTSSDGNEAITGIFNNTKGYGTGPVYGIKNFVTGNSTGSSNTGYYASVSNNSNSNIGFEVHSTGSVGKNYAVKAYTGGSQSDSKYLYYGSASGTGTKWGLYLVGSNQNYIEGHLGIGISNPGAGIVVAGSGFYDGAIGLKNTGSGLEWRINSSPNGHLEFIKITGSTFVAMSIEQNSGKVGIGTSGPVQKLEVNGNILTRGSYYMSDNDSRIFMSGTDMHLSAQGNIYLDPNGGRSYLNYNGIPYAFFDGSNKNLIIGSTTSQPNTKIFATNSSGYNTATFINDYPSSGTDVLFSNYTSTSSYDATAVHGLSVPADNYGWGGMFEGGYIGVQGKVMPSGNFTYRAVQANISGGSGVNYGIYSDAAGGASNFAGYFVGNVTVTGTFSNPSDRKFKQNIRQENDALSGVMQLKPSEYEFIQNGIGANFHFAQGLQHGFIAQDLEKVFPELVNNEISTIPGTKNERIEYKSVNYLGMIPVLTKAIQEQQEYIEQLEKRIDALEKQ